MWDFDASVRTVRESVARLRSPFYVLISTVDVYDDVGNLERTTETASIEHRRLTTYGFHKWLAERLVERFASGALILRVGTVIGPMLKKGALFDLRLPARRVTRRR